MDDDNLVHITYQEIDQWFAEWRCLKRPKEKWKTYLFNKIAEKEAQEPYITPKELFEELIKKNGYN